MENLKEIRWRQRYENLKRAYALYQEGVQREELNRLEKEGLIQRFEYTFELSWKTLKDYLEAKGLLVSYPRDVIKEAFTTGLVTNGDIWMEMLERRNLLSHTYDEATFDEAFMLVSGPFFRAMSELVEKLRTEL